VTHHSGLVLPNPFVIGSGPPGTNYAVMKKAFEEGWGGVIAKTISIDSSKVGTPAAQKHRVPFSDTTIGNMHVAYWSQKTIAFSPAGGQCHPSIRKAQGERQQGGACSTRMQSCSFETLQRMRYLLELRSTALPMPHGRVMTKQSDTVILPYRFWGGRT